MGKKSIFLVEEEAEAVAVVKAAEVRRRKRRW